jgi:Protein of unknown function (DUF664)
MLQDHGAEPERQNERMDSELEALKDYLDGQREHVVGILEGLSEDDLRRAVLPTGWNCLGLLRHLTMDVERFWFAGVFAGDPDVAAQLRAGAEAHWQVPDGMSTGQVLAGYRREIDRADALLAAAGERPGALEEKPAAWPAEIWPGWRLPDLRHILLHVITEVACHAGHLDAARELIDGTTWSAPDPYAPADS